jgi:hypothetical protein
MMHENTIPSFEALVALSKEDPAEFEALRIQLCQQILDQAPEHLTRRLNGIQFKINMERRRSKTAMKSCLEISKLMNNSLIELEGVLSNPQEFLQTHNQNQLEEKDLAKTEQTSAEIIQLFPEASITSKPVPED